MEKYIKDRSYSQHGEDILLKNILTMLKISKPTYIDIGSFHPCKVSNTMLLYEGEEG